MDSILKVAPKLIWCVAGLQGLDSQDQLCHHLYMVHMTELGLIGYLVSSILATEAALKCSALVELKLERKSKYHFHRLPSNKDAVEQLKGEIKSSSN